MVGTSWVMEAWGIDPACSYEANSKGMVMFFQPDHRKFIEIDTFREVGWAKVKL